jgi:hypothetical protein
MAGILGNGWDDPQSSAIMALAGGLLKGDFGGGILGANQAYGEARMNAQKAKLLQAQILETQAQGQERMLKGQAEQRAMELARQKQSALPNLFGGQTVGGELSAPTMGGIPMFSQGATLTPTRQVGAGQFDVQGAIKAGFSPKEIMEYAALRNANQDEVARTIEGRDGNNRPITTQYDKFGRPVGAPVEQWKAPVFESLGDRKVALDPVTLQRLQEFKINQSPDSAASNALGWANNRLAGQKFTFEQGQSQKPTFHDGAWILPPSAENPKGQAMPVPGLSNSKPLTEDQGKATGWLVQAENAFKNMKAVGIDKQGNPTSAAYPGINDALESLPGGSPAANFMRSGDRQKFIQSSSSLSEALLRAATGAGVNKEEAAQKIRELTPVFGEDAGTTRQKMESIPLYIESLKVRAGPGASRAAGVLNGQPGSSGGQATLRFNAATGKLEQVK